MKLFIDINDNKKYVGDLIDRTYVKRVKASVHMFRIKPAWAIDAELITLLDAQGCNMVKLIDTENNTVYEAPLVDIKEKGFRKHFKGYGSQVFLALKHWITFKPR